MTNGESKKAAREQRRKERRAARERRRNKRDAAGVARSLPDDEVGGPNLMPAEQQRRRRAFELIEQTCSELIAVRGRQVIALSILAAGTDEHSSLAREIEALDDEIDDLRELSEDLLRRVAPLELLDARLGQLEQMLTTAQTLASASARSKALLGAAQELLTALDNALDGEG